MSAVTIVTQTRVAEASAELFGQLQARASALVAAQPGFLDQSVLPPKPPVQVDWVILQRFHSADAAGAWLRSPRRVAMVAEIAPHTAGPDDVHLVPDDASGPLPAPVSVVFTTRVKPGAEAAFKAWEQRVAAAQARAPGFQGYRFETPIPGVQDDYVAILRFETEAALQGWMASPERAALLTEAEALTETVRSRVVQTGFSQWFPTQAGAAAPAWKQNMVVLMLLYPTVFLFGLAVMTPVLLHGLGLPFWLALFLANAASILVLGVLVPRVSRLFGWWLHPRAAGRGTDARGAAVVAAVWALCMAVFSRL